MIKIIGNDIKRDGEKLGWIAGNDVRDMSNRKLGYVVGDDIFRGSDGSKIAFVDGAFVVIGSSGKKMSIVENKSKHVSGGSISDAMRAAIKLFFGD